MEFSEKNMEEVDIEMHNEALLRTPWETYPIFIPLQIFSVSYTIPITILAKKNGFSVTGEMIDKKNFKSFSAAKAYAQKVILEKIGYTGSALEWLDGIIKRQEALMERYIELKDEFDYGWV